MFKNILKSIAWCLLYIISLRHQTEKFTDERPKIAPVLTYIMYRNIYEEVLQLPHGYRFAGTSREFCGSLGAGIKKAGPAGPALNYLMICTQLSSNSTTFSTSAFEMVGGCLI